MLKVGVIGVGKMGSHHVRVFKEMPGVVLDCVYDPRFAAIVPESFGVRVCASAHELLSRVDVVVVASPSDTHFAYACAALKVGKDLLIEKPFCLDPAAARTLARLAERHKRIVAVGHVEHFNSNFINLRKAIGDQEIVRFKSVRYNLTGDSTTDVVDDLMTHDLGLMLALFGADYETTVIDATRFDGCHAACTLLLDKRVLAKLIVDRSSACKRRYLKVITDDAHHVCDLLALPTDDPLTKQAEAFVRAVRERRQPLIGIPEAFRVLRLVDQIKSLAAQPSPPQAVRAGGVAH